MLLFFALIARRRMRKNDVRPNERFRSISDLMKTPPHNKCEEAGNVVIKKE